MVFINATTTTGIILNAGITNVFGSEAILFMVLLLVLVVLAISFKMPIELIIPLMLPIIIYMMAQNVEMLAIGGLALIFIGFLFAYWIIRQ